MTAQTSWTPTKNVVRHTGSPLKPEMDFFATPPLEIGTIISAESTLVSAEQLIRTRTRQKACCLWGLGGVLCGGFIALVVELPLLMCVLVGAAFGIGGAILTTQFFYQCSYVGELGIALYSLRGNRAAEPKAQIFCFKDGKNLYTQQTRNYYNGIYTGTNYKYWWPRLSDSEFKLEGTYRNKDGNPPENDLYHFANAAEGSWSIHLLQVVNEQLNQRGYVEFPIKSALNAVRIGPGFMEFEERNGMSQRVEVVDMKDIRLGSGIFQFKHKDSTWWSGKGKYSFAYKTIPNARLFLICLDRLTGIHW